MVFPQVKKDTVEVVIKTLNERIEGTIYKLPDTRLIDMMNKSQERFLAVSNARIYHIDEPGKPLFETNFLIINKSHVVNLFETYTVPDANR